MADFTLLRRTVFPTWTFGVWLAPGDVYVCKTVEDIIRPNGEEKVYGETAIDARRYCLSFAHKGNDYNSSLFHKMVANRNKPQHKKRWAEGMIILPIIEEEVGSDRCGRHRQVRAHTGSNPGSSLGCPLTTMEADINGGTRYTTDVAFKRLHDILLPYFRSGEECFLDVRNPA